MRNFRKLEIWNNGIEIVKQVYLITEVLPAIEKYGILSQITRAAVSIPSNIAEGSSRKSEKEFARYLQIAIGSLFEVETQLIIMIKLNLVSEENVDELLKLILREEKMINSLMTKIYREIGEKKANS